MINTVHWTLLSLLNNLHDFQFNINKNRIFKKMLRKLQFHSQTKKKLKILII